MLISLARRWPIQIITVSLEIKRTGDLSSLAFPDSGLERLQLEQAASHHGLLNHRLLPAGSWATHHCTVSSMLQHPGAMPASCTQEQAYATDACRPFSRLSICCPYEYRYQLLALLQHVLIVFDRSSNLFRNFAKIMCMPHDITLPIILPPSNIALRSNKHTRSTSNHLTPQPTPIPFYFFVA